MIHISIGVLVFSCLSLNAQEFEIDSIYNADIDTSYYQPSKKETKRANHQLKLANSPAFYNHDDRPGRKAAFYSLALPGLGQAYNRKYWKIPIVYGAIGTTLYFTVSNSQKLKQYNTALSAELRGETHQFSGILTEAQITRSRNFYRKNTELSALLTALFWGLNIVDAVVDAHLFKFDISDDLSFQWYPDLLTGNNSVIPSIHLSLQFK
ncbi:MAG: DUF5683 domain-containing protein [Chitinophagales bacterium]